MSLSLKVILSLVLVISIIILLLLSRRKFKKTWIKVALIALSVVLLGALRYIWFIPESKPPSHEPLETSKTAPETQELSSDSTEATTPKPTIPDDNWLSDLDPNIHPDPLDLRNIQYESRPTFEVQNDLSKFVLHQFLNNNFEFELFLDSSWAFDEGTGYGILNTACETAMSYYLFSAYKTIDMFTNEPDADGKVYAKVKLEYSEPEYDLEARLKALEFIEKNPAPRDGFQDFESEKAYARKIHDFVAKKVTYSPIGYDPESMFGLEKYEAFQEAYNVLGEGQDSAVCAGYARAFALIAQYAGINAAWVYGNETDEESHAWNVIYPCDSSEPVLIDVTWDDTGSDDSPMQEYVNDWYFYIPLSEEYEHTPSIEFHDFLEFIN